MKFGFKVHYLLIPVILFTGLLFYLQVDLYSVLPYELGGMSFGLELKNVWYRSVLFYTLLALIAFFCYFQFFAKSKK